MAQETFSLPKAWSVYSTSKDLYTSGKSAEPRSGAACAYLSSKNAGLKHHALLLQKIQGTPYVGRRLRLTGYLKAQAIKGWAGIWIRVDDDKGQVLSFENMMKTPLRGSSDWKKFSIEVDVPEGAEEIHFGTLLAGSGTVKADDFTLEGVGPERRRQNLKQRIRNLPEKAQNLDFEQ